MKSGILSLLLLTAAGSALAADPVQPAPERKTVFSFATGFNTSDVEVRRTFMGGRIAAIVLAGYTDQSIKTDVGTFSGHSLELGVGLRKNFSISDQIRPFAQIDVSRVRRQQRELYDVAGLAAPCSRVFREEAFYGVWDNSLNPRELSPRNRDLASHFASLAQLARCTVSGASGAAVTVEHSRRAGGEGSGRFSQRGAGHRERGMARRNRGRHAGGEGCSVRPPAAGVRSGRAGA